MIYHTILVRFTAKMDFPLILENSAFMNLRLRSRSRSKILERVRERRSPMLCILKHKMGEDISIYDKFENQRRSILCGAQK